MTNTGRLIVTLKGTELTAKEKELVSHPMVAGFIFFTENYMIPTDFGNKPQLGSLVNEIRAIANKPCFIDQEGGYVQRFGRGFECLPPAKLFARTYVLDPNVAKQLAYEYGQIMARELLEFGIISFAPVCDLDAGNTVITRLGRSFNAEPRACTELLHAYIDGMNSAGMNATGKHFPGHGQNNGDTHNNLVYDHRTLEEIENNDLHVFIELIKANKLAAIMPAHIVYTQVDPDHTAGTSKIWLEDILRIKYGYKGIIVSDCLSMVGAGNSSLLDKSKQALEFCDLAILCHQEPEEVLKLCDALLKAQLGLNKSGQARFAAWIERLSSSVELIPS